MHSSGQMPRGWLNTERWRIHSRVRTARAIHDACPVPTPHPPPPNPPTQPLPPPPFTDVTHTPDCRFRHPFWSHPDRHPIRPSWWTVSWSWRGAAGMGRQAMLAWQSYRAPLSPHLFRCQGRWWCGVVACILCVDLWHSLKLGFPFLLAQPEHDFRLFRPMNCFPGWLSDESRVLHEVTVFFVLLVSA